MQINNKMSLSTKICKHARNDRNTRRRRSQMQAAHWSSAQGPGVTLCRNVQSTQQHSRVNSGTILSHVRPQTVRAFVQRTFLQSKSTATRCFEQRPSSTYLSTIVILYFDAAIWTHGRVRFQMEQTKHEHCACSLTRAIPFKQGCKHLGWSVRFQLQSIWHQT